MFGVVTRRFSNKGLGGSVRLYAKTASNQNVTKAAQINENVPGLSEKCVSVPKQPVGPGAAKDKEYKNPEYYCYNVDSFAEAEVEMAKFRLPAPSNKRKFVPQ